MNKVAQFEVTSPPANPPPFAVTLEELKGHLRIDSSDEDTELTLFLSVSEEKIACYLNQVFAPQTVRGNFTCVECSKYERYPFISFRRYPVRDFVVVEVWNGDSFGALSETVDWLRELRDKGFARILFKNAGDLNIGATDIAYPIRISADVGYGDADEVPLAIKNAILMYASYLYETRGDCSGGGSMGLPKNIKTLLSCYKIQETFS